MNLVPAGCKNYALQSASLAPCATSQTAMNYLMTYPFP
jgi:hypothetical protein